jgi:hypothetical protein
MVLSMNYSVNTGQSQLALILAMLAMVVLYSGTVMSFGLGFAVTSLLARLSEEVDLSRAPAMLTVGLLWLLTLYVFVRIVRKRRRHHRVELSLLGLGIFGPSLAGILCVWNAQGFLIGPVPILVIVYMVVWTIGAFQAMAGNFDHSVGRGS